MERTARTDRRDSEIVRQTAELLSLGIPLSELFERFCLLLAEFVDASVVFIALESERGTHIEFAYDHGRGLRDAHLPIEPASQSRRVMQSGQSILMREPEDLPPRQIPLKMPWGTIEDTQSAIFVPLRYGAHTIGVLSVQTFRPRAYDRSDLQLLETCALYVAVAVQSEFMRTQKERAEAIATVDTVTGAGTRRLFDERLLHEWKRARRTGEMVAVILMDIDHFKVFNDTYGHVAGDSCLAQVAQAAGACVSRSTDLFARYGGEEFAAILYDIEPENALAIAERMRHAVAELQIPHATSEAGFVTASFGIACSRPPCDDPRPLLRSADEALYAAKAAGRNRSCLQGRQLQTHASIITANLPASPAPFIGRKVELDALSRSLALARMTTIVGPSGVGKTRCSIAVARQLLQAYAHGTWFVDLSAVHDGAAVEGVLCQALHAPLESLAAKHCLLILDSCDRVAEATAALCERILDLSPRTTIVTTSRTPTGSRNERIFHLSALTGEDAEALFCERAAAAVPGTIFDACDRERIRALCAQLGDLPLAITLAAPRVKTLGITQVADALRGCDLEATIAWSYSLLDHRAQRLFERLAVFARCFDADAARNICSFAPLRPGEAAAAFDELVEANLIVEAPRSSGDRFMLLESTRAYADARLRQRRESDDVARRHTAYYLSLARRIAEQLSRDGAEHALMLAVRESPEFRVARQRAVSDEIDSAAIEQLLLALN